MCWCLRGVRYCCAAHEQPGDLLLLATDGVWDNLFRLEILELLCSHDLPGGMGVAVKLPHPASHFGRRFNVIAEMVVTWATMQGDAPLSDEPQDQAMLNGSRCVFVAGIAPSADATTRASSSATPVVPAAADLLVAAEAIAAAANTRGLDSCAESPFGVGAREANAGRWEGGKIDDVTVLLAAVAAPPAAAMRARM